MLILMLIMALSYWVYVVASNIIAYYNITT